MNTTELVIAIIFILLWILRWFLKYRETGKGLILMFIMWALMGTACFGLTTLTGMPLVIPILTGYPNLDNILTWLICIAVIVFPAFLFGKAAENLGWKKYLNATDNVLNLGSVMQFLFGVILIGVFVKICSWTFSWLFAK